MRPDLDDRYLRATRGGTDEGIEKSSHDLIHRQVVALTRIRRTVRLLRS